MLNHVCANEYYCAIFGRVPLASHDAAAHESVRVRTWAVCTYEYVQVRCLDLNVSLMTGRGCPPLHLPLLSLSCQPQHQDISGQSTRIVIAHGERKAWDHRRVGKLPIFPAHALDDDSLRIPNTSPSLKKVPP